MGRAQILEIRRKIDERKAGFSVEGDPWELVEQLLEENEQLQAKIESAYVGFQEGPW